MSRQELVCTPLSLEDEQFYEIVDEVPSASSIRSSVSYCRFGKSDYDPYKPQRREVAAPKFDGRMDWVDYFNSFLAVCKWNQWNYHEKGLQLAMALVGEAVEVLSTLGVLKYDFDSLISAIQFRYYPPGMELQYKRKLMNFMCSAAQDINAYGHELKRLAIRAYPDGIDEKFLIDLFIRGLPNDAVSRHVYLAKPFSFSEALKIAVTFQSFDNCCENINDVSHIHSSHTSSSSSSDRVDTLVSLLENMNSKLDSKSKKCEKSNTGRPKAITCHYCQLRGHKVKECPSIAKLQNMSIANP